MDISQTAMQIRKKINSNCGGISVEKKGLTIG